MTRSDRRYSDRCTDRYSDADQRPQTTDNRQQRCFYRNFCLLKRLPPSLRSVANDTPAGQTLGARTTKTKNVTTDRARGNQRGARNDRQEQR